MECLHTTFSGGNGSARAWAALVILIVELLLAGALANRRFHATVSVLECVLDLKGTNWEGAALV